MSLPSLFRALWHKIFSLLLLACMSVLITSCQSSDRPDTRVVDASQSTKYYYASDSQRQRYAVNNLPDIAIPQKNPPPQLASLPPQTPVPPDIAPIEPLFADLIEVKKSERKLTLFHQGTMMREYQMVLGFNPNGHKEKEGDGRTPEGIYEITYKNPQSKFHRSLRISYPNAYDKAIAAAKGVSPGGDIVIHGLPNDDPYAERTQHPNRDWTWGCIAVNNTEIREIWELVPSGTPIHIFP